ncbi:hypothetical protein Tco_1411336, partial [Tanacetum coccineum]
TSAGIEGLAECKASASNLRRIQVKYIVKKVKDYLKTYSSVEMDISWLSLNVKLPKPSDTRDTKIAAIRLKFNAFKALKDVEEDLRSSSEIIVDLNTEYHERALLANQKRFYKRTLSERMSI